MHVDPRSASPDASILAAASRLGDLYTMLATLDDARLEHGDQPALVEMEHERHAEIRGLEAALLKVRPTTLVGCFIVLGVAREGLDSAEPSPEVVAVSAALDAVLSGMARAADIDLRQLGLGALISHAT